MLSCRMVEMQTGISARTPTTCVRGKTAILLLDLHLIETVLSFQREEMHMAQSEAQKEQVTDYKQRFYNKQ